MSFNRVFHPFLSDDDIKVIEQVIKRDKNVVNLCLMPTQECDVICPVDEVTGNRTNRLTKLNDPTLSPLERDRIMSTLQQMPTAKRNNLSDDELISMLPSRYNSTLVDNAKYAAYLRDEIDNMSSSDNSSQSVENTDDTSTSE